MPRPGGNGVFNVTALTLRQLPSGSELYAAVRNDGDTPACSPAFSIEIFDKTEQMVAVDVSGLLVHRFYRLTDGSDTIAACVAPGEVSMVALKSLPSDLGLEGAVTRLHLNYWVLDVAPTAASASPPATSDRGGGGHTRHRHQD